MRAPVLAALMVCLVAGCASKPLPTDSSAVSPSLTSLTAAAEPNKQRADAEAAKLLALAPVPPGAAEIATAQADLSGPAMGTPATSSLIDDARYWQVPMSFDAALAWVKAHPPAGLTFGGSTSGSGPGEQSGGYSYLASDSPASTGGALELGVASVSADVSDIRADGVTEWLDPVPVRDDATGPRMRLTVAGGCPGTDANDDGVTNTAADLGTKLLPTAAPTGGLMCEYGGLNGQQFGLVKSTTLNSTASAQLASAVTSSSLSHLDNVITSCPADFGSITVLVLSYSSRADVDLWYSRTGCQWLANGFITTSPSDALDELVNPAASGPPFPVPAATS